MHTIIKSLLVVLLVSSSAACIAVEEETSVIEGADGAEVTEEAQEALAASAVESGEAPVGADEAQLVGGDEAQLVGGGDDARDPNQSAIFYACFRGWTAYNDCNNYGASGRAYGYWSGYQCNYGNVYGGTCYQGYALYVW
jgi:hypothetical protein